MPILNMFIYLIGAVVLLVALMWGVSLITATALMAYYEWKDRR
jgi:hypothetical protein